MKADNKLDKTRNKSYKKLALSFLLTVFKLLVGLSGNSTLLLADAIRSFSEFINESIRFLDLSIANKPEDKNHNYGHGKITTLCTGAGACMLLLASFHTFSLSSGELLMFIQGKEPEAPGMIALFAAVSAFVSRDIIFAENDELRVKESPSKARARIKRLFLSGFVILGIGCTFLPGKGFDIADSFAAVLLSLYLLWNSGRLLYRTTDELIEASLEDENNRRIREIISQTENVTDCGELKTRRIGRRIAINVCLSVNNSLSVREAVEIANLVEERLKAAFEEDTYVLIKIEPNQGKKQTFKTRGRSSEEERRKTGTLV